MNLTPKKNDDIRLSSISKLSSSNNIDIRYSSFSPDRELKEDLKIFLRIEREVKMYSEKGEISKRIIFLNENYDTIISTSVGSNKIDIKEKMHIKEMDTCIRSAATTAFSKAKGFFTKSI